jgi:hypothetical protein
VFPSGTSTRRERPPGRAGRLGEQATILHFMVQSQASYQLDDPPTGSGANLTNLAPATQAELLG